MDHHLASDLHQLDTILAQVRGLALDYLHTIDTRPPAAGYVPLAPLPLPDTGMGSAAGMRLFDERFGRHMPASNGPRFWGFVTGGATPAALAGDWLVSTYDLNLSAAANSIAPDIEHEALALLRALFGLPADLHGIFVTGATMANVTGLAIGREWLARQHGVSIAQQGLHAIPPVTVLSGAAHSSVGKALAMLGMGRSALQPVPTLPESREAVDIGALRRALAELQGAPCIVVANAGTVNTVDFDDLRAIAALKAEFSFWLHVDAAFGGFAACSPRFAHLMAGADQADSLTIDAHKWLNVPYDAAMLFTRHRDLQVATFQNSAAYLGELTEPVDFVHLGPENSRRLRALPVWLTLMAYGRAGYRDIVERNCAQARRLGDLVDASDAFDLLAPVHMNVVCFAPRRADKDAIDAFLARLRDDGRVFLTPTVFHGRPAIRAALSNWRTEDSDVTLAWEAMCACV
ncbi:MAG: aspartate aminotransferase family protein [Caldilineaceae bacterium]|nr:aspartate aminotransferase family protein [Caldilineaceae bacterium]